MMPTVTQIAAHQNCDQMHCKQSRWLHFLHFCTQSNGPESLIDGYLSTLDGQVQIVLQGMCQFEAKHWGEEYAQTQKRIVVVVDCQEPADAVGWLVSERSKLIACHWAVVCYVKAHACWPVWVVHDDSFTPCRTKSAVADPTLLRCWIQKRFWHPLACHIAVNCLVLTIGTNGKLSSHPNSRGVCSAQSIFW